MDPNNIIGYISGLDRLSRKDPEVDEKSIDIPEQFAWKKHLSAYQICSNLKSTHSKMAYKNVNKRTNALLSSGLIQKLETSIHSKHNAKYYRLTEYGIYQLFLNRLDSLLVNQSDVRKGNEISQSLNALTFFRNYVECGLFKIFLYPYFKKETLLAIGSSLLWDLYNYLSICCIISM
jgi:DNA-binding PadR family transcriptional regulator